MIYLDFSYMYNQEYIIIHYHPIKTYDEDGLPITC